MIRGYGNKERLYQDVADLINANGDRESISKSTVFRTVSHFQQTGSVKDEVTSERPEIRNK